MRIVAAFLVLAVHAAGCGRVVIEDSEPADAEEGGPDATLSDADGGGPDDVVSIDAGAPDAAPDAAPAVDAGISSRVAAVYIDEWNVHAGSGWESGFLVVANELGDPLSIDDVSIVSVTDDSLTVAVNVDLLLDRGTSIMPGSSAGYLDYRARQTIAAAGLMTPNRDEDILEAEIYVAGAPVDPIDVEVVVTLAAGAHVLDLPMTLHIDDTAFPNSMGARRVESALP